MQQKRRWDASIKIFTKAEEVARLEVGSDTLRLQSRACRGIGFSLVELKKLDAAEKNYNRCLSIDPADSQSQKELLFIQKLRGGQAI